MSGLPRISGRECAKALAKVLSLHGIGRHNDLSVYRAVWQAERLEIAL